MSTLGLNVNYEAILALEDQKRNQILEAVSRLCVDQVQEGDQQYFFELVKRFPGCFSSQELVVSIQSVRAAVDGMMNLNISDEARKNLGPEKLWYPLSLGGVEMKNWCGDLGKAVPVEFQQQLVGKVLEPGRWVQAEGVKHQLTWLEVRSGNQELIITPGELVPEESKIFCLGLVEEGKIIF
jgi:hypothetical protein